MVYAQTRTIQENEPDKILRGFEIQMDHLIPVKRPDLVLINQKEENLQSSGFYCSGRPQSENQRKQK